MDSASAGEIAFLFLIAQCLHVFLFQIGLPRLPDIWLSCMSIKYSLIVKLSLLSFLHLRFFIHCC